MTIAKTVQVEKNLPDWFMEMFCEFDWLRQVWIVCPEKLAK
jgi:hypothetical protein